MEELSLIIGEERQDFFVEETLVTIFKSTVERHPSKTALYFNGKQISYKILDEWSTNLAYILQSKGLKKGSPCLVWWERGIELHVAILAILKCGGMERKNSVQKPRLRARCKNSSKIHCPRSKPPDPSFLIASSLWIAELEDIQGLNSLMLAELLGVRYLCLDIL